MSKLLSQIRNPVIPIQWGTKEGAQANGIGSFISHLISAIIIFGVLFCLVYLLWGAVEWLISGGEEEKLKGARGKITNAVIGLTLVVATFAIWKLITFFLGLSNLELPEPETTFGNATNTPTPNTNFFMQIIKNIPNFLYRRVIP